MRHLLDQRLAGELLRAAGEVLGGVGGAGRYDRGSRCRGRVHHGRRARRVMLVRPLLGQVGNWRQITGGFRVGETHVEHVLLVPTVAHGVNYYQGQGGMGRKCGFPHLYPVCRA